MIFAHDTEVALAGCRGAGEHRRTGRRTLPDAGRAGRVRPRPGAGPGTPRTTAAELRAVRELRPRLRRLWQVDEDGVVQIVNRLLRDANALPQLVRHDEWDYHLHATPPHAPLATRMAVEAAMALTDVIRVGELSRLRICE